MPDDVKTEVIWQALEILDDSLAPARTRLAAMKLLRALDQADLAAAKLRLDRERVEREGQARADPSAVRALDPEAAARALKAAFPDADVFPSFPSAPGVDAGGCAGPGGPTPPS